MLKAKLDSVRKNKKGFSLVELIIVIAIMVALIAVMAPAFVKYVQKSRDAAIATAAEDFEKAVQTYIGDPDTDITQVISSGNSATIKVYVASGSDANNEGTESTKNYLSIQNTGVVADTFTELKNLAGADTKKPMGATEKYYTITITKDATTKELTVSMIGS